MNWRKVFLVQLMFCVMLSLPLSAAYADGEITTWADLQEALNAGGTVEAISDNPGIGGENCVTTLDWSYETMNTLSVKASGYKGTVDMMKYFKDRDDPDTVFSAGSYTDPGSMNWKILIPDQDSRLYRLRPKQSQAQGLDCFNPHGYGHF